MKPKFKFRNPILGYFPEMASGDIASHELLAQKHLFLVTVNSRNFASLNLTLTDRVGGRFLGGHCNHREFQQQLPPTDKNLLEVPESVRNKSSSTLGK